MTNPAPTPPPAIPDVFYTVSTTIICNSEAEALDVCARMKAAFAAERQALETNPCGPWGVGTFLMYVVKMGQAHVRTLLLQLATLVAAHPEASGDLNPPAQSIVNAIRRSQSAGGN